MKFALFHFIFAIFILGLFIAICFDQNPLSLSARIHHNHKNKTIKLCTEHFNCFKLIVLWYYWDNG